MTFISSETDEMLRTCSRLIVMRDRKKVGELSGHRAVSWTQLPEVTKNNAEHYNKKIKKYYGYVQR